MPSPHLEDPVRSVGTLRAGWTALVLALGLLLAGTAGAQDVDLAALAVNDVCPVMPEEGVLDDVEIFVEHEGRTIALCCKRCRKEWLKDPEPYVAWLEENGYLAGPPADAAATPVPLDGDTIGVPAQAEDPTPAPAEQAPRLPASSAARPQEPSWSDAALERLGRFHPMVAHFPVALLLAALLAQVLGAWRGRAGYEAAGRFCLAFGTVGAIVAALLGWASAATSGYPSQLQQDLFLHRWAGTATAALAVLAWCTRERTGGLHRTLLVLAALGVGAAGYLGANLIYGPGHLFGP